MKLINSVFELAEKFTKNPTWVNIDYSILSDVARELRNTVPPQFNKEKKTNQFKICMLELVMDSINYCYWYGKHDIRPLNSSTSKMFKLIELCFEHYSENSSFFKILINELTNLLSLERFPLLEERIKHLNELKENGVKFVKLVIESDKDNVEPLLEMMVQFFPGYASDLFLKRAILFFSELNRKFGWFEKSMNNIPVSADYQVPKMLEYYDILEYSKSLKEGIEACYFIPKDSIIECEIRASTIIACRQLCKETGWTMPQIDSWFWLKRHIIDKPFHLCTTTDY